MLSHVLKKEVILYHIHFCVLYGVCQGENLSPLVFAIYLNDFAYFVSRHYNGLYFLANNINNFLSDSDIEDFFRAVCVALC